MLRLCPAAITLTLGFLATSSQCFSCVCISVLLYVPIVRHTYKRRSLFYATDCLFVCVYTSIRLRVRDDDDGREPLLPPAGTTSEAWDKVGTSKDLFFACPRRGRPLTLKRSAKDTTVTPQEPMTTPRILTALPFPPHQTGVSSCLLSPTVAAAAAAPLATTPTVVLFVRICSSSC